MEETRGALLEQVRVPSGTALGRRGKRGTGRINHGLTRMNTDAVRQKRDFIHKTYFIYEVLPSSRLVKCRMEGRERRPRLAEAACEGGSPHRLERAALAGRWPMRRLALLWRSCGGESGSFAEARYAQSKAASPREVVRRRRAWSHCGSLRRSFIFRVQGFGLRPLRVQAS